MRILVTGASGFLGRRVIESLLSLDAEVHASARRSADSPVPWHIADLLDSDQRRRLIEDVSPSHLIHLAWTTEHGVFWESPQNHDWAVATIDLLERFADAGGIRAVATGSCAEYDWSDPALAGGTCNELATPLAPTSEYGRAKLDTFQKASHLADRTDIDLAWARLFFLYGVDEHSERLVPALIQSALRSDATELRHPNRVLDLMNTADAAAALVAVLLSDLTGPVNVATGHGIRLSELSRLIRRLVDGEETPTTTPKPGGDSAALRLVADVTRLSTGAQFDPKYDLEASLTPIVEWWSTKHNSDPTTINR